MKSAFGKQYSLQILLVLVPFAHWLVTNQT
jgi:hypothetical protein